MRSTFSGYSHRHNKDGSYDAICLRCFRTVGHELNEQALKLLEVSHDCDAVEREDAAGASMFQH